jgi:hypothetical protein
MTSARSVNRRPRLTPDRHAIFHADSHPQQRYGWRREMRIIGPEPPVSSVPAVGEAADDEETAGARAKSAPLKAATLN